MINRRKKRRFGKLLYFLFAFSIALITINHYYELQSNKPLKLTSPLSSVLPFSTSNLNNLKNSNSLALVVLDSLKETKGKYGVVIKNLKTNESYYLNEHNEFETASLYKLWIMGTAFKQLENNKLKEEETLKEEIAVLNEKFRISTEAAELKDGDIEFTVNSALNQMITISHNYAALILTARIRLRNVDLFLKENGFLESKVGINGDSPKSTPYDIALFLEKLYKGELASIDNTQKMLDLLKKQKLNNKLPKYLSPDIVIAHKTGELDYFSHDAGIVYNTNGDYIIVVFSESEFPDAANDRIANLSKNVYEYFKNKNNTANK